MIRRYYKQQKEILLAATRISTMFDPSMISSQSNEIASLLTVLSKQISDHMSLDQDTLYHALLDSDEENISRELREMASMTGQLQSMVHGLHANWATPELISSDSESFIQEAQALFSSITDRFELEDERLHPHILAANKQTCIQ